MRDGEEDGGKNRYGKVLAEPKTVTELEKEHELSRERWSRIQLR